MNFNPKVKEYLSDNPNATMLQLWWALSWRPFLLYVLIGVLLHLIV